MHAREPQPQGFRRVAGWGQARAHGDGVRLGVLQGGHAEVAGLVAAVAAVHVLAQLLRADVHVAHDALQARLQPTRGGDQCLVRREGCCALMYSSSQQECKPQNTQELLS